MRSSRSILSVADNPKVTQTVVESCSEHGSMMPRWRMGQ